MLTIDVVTFATVIESAHHLADPRSVKIELDPRGSTALYDAIGVSFNNFGKALADLPEHAPPGTVLVTIVTEGEENSSQEYSAGTVKAMIAHQKAAFDWDISFLGANQDAVLEAQKIGIGAADAPTFDAAAVAGTMTAHAQKLSRRRQGDRAGYNADERRAAGGET